MLKPMLIKRSDWEEFGEVLLKTMSKIQKGGGTIKDIQYSTVNNLKSRSPGVETRLIQTLKSEFTVLYDDGQDSIHVS